MEGEFAAAIISGALIYIMFTITVWIYMQCDMVSTG